MGTRAQEVARQAADCIEGLYKQLERNPPPEAVDLVKELRAMAAGNILDDPDILSNPDILK